MHTHRNFHLQNSFMNMNYTKKKCALWKSNETWPLPFFFYIFYDFILSHLVELGKLSALAFLIKYLSIEI